MLTIIRKNLLLTINDNVIPAMGSSDVPVKFVNDTETYVGFLIEPRVGYYVNGCPKSGICEYDTSSNIIKIPAEAFKNKGILVIAIALIDSADSNHIEVTKELALEITPAPNGTVILPATDTWQTAVKNLVEQLYNQDYKPQFDQIEEDLSGLVEEAENQQSKAKEQQTQIDNAIDIMGDYEIVQDNPTQIRFKKGDGTYGDTVNLGDNLASKSMVNAGYDTYIGNSYSGSASDYGIEIAKASGNYEQVETNGYQLFDASKIQTTTQGGATVTNNGDGSFTISGSGQLSNSFSTGGGVGVNKEVKKGNLYVKVEKATVPYFCVDIYWGDTWKRTIKTKSLNYEYTEITQEDINNDVNVRFKFMGASGETITGGTIKPMLYQDGDGTWEPFTGGEPSPNPNYAQEPKFFEPNNVYSVGKNLFNGVLEVGNISNGNNTNDTGILRSKDYINVKPNHEYCFSIDGVLNRLVVSCYDENKNYLNDTLEGIICENGAFKTLDKTKYIRFRSFREDKTKFETLEDKIQIEEGSVASYFVPYKGQSTTPLNITLRSLPNGVRDTYENGIVTRRVGYIEFDGSEDENWKFVTTENTNTLRFDIRTLVNHDSKSVNQNDGICNRLVFSAMYDNTDYEHIRFSSSVADAVVVFINKSNLPSNDLNGFKTWLQSNPIKVWYELAEPHTEQVDLPVIPSYFPFTNAWHDSEVEASELTWNILARQYGSGQTTIKKDEAVLTELDLNTERTATPTTVKVQLKDTSGNVFYVETSADNVYLKGTDGTEISQQNLNDKIGQLINLVSFYSANPTTVLADLKKYITTII